MNRAGNRGARARGPFQNIAMRRGSRGGSGGSGGSGG